MKNVISETKQATVLKLIIFKDETAGGNYTIIRKDNIRSHHAHYNNRKAANLVKKLTMAGIKCNIKRLREGQQRLLTQEEFDQLEDQSSEEATK